jgi:SWI/SNF-related matrix-associated actin-dependent regulator of chromatin subfamily A3
MYGPINVVERARIEGDLKRDKLLKASQLKQTRKEAEERRRDLGLKSNSTVGGLQTTGEGEDNTASLQNLLGMSEAVEFRKGGDVVKTLAMDENFLSQMPQAAQPSQIKATLLPYQLQVRGDAFKFLPSLNLHS